jgi:hypothetical protein
MNNEPIKVTIPTELTYEDFENLIVGAIEGGSNYWALIRTSELPMEIRNTYKGEPASVKISKAIWEGHTVKVYDAEDEDESWEINREKVATGLVKMATDYPNHYNNFRSDNGDAETSDVFFQLISIGDLTFG